MWLYSVTFVGVLNVCAMQVHLERAGAPMSRSWKVYVSLISFVGNILVDIYVKCGSMEEAWRASDKMRGIKLW